MSTTHAADLDQEFADLGTEYYPGSNKPIAPAPGRLNTSAAPAAGEGKARPWLSPQPRQSGGYWGGWDDNPRKYVVNSVETEFFTVGQLAQALGRQAVTLRKWEREGIIPKSTFQSPGLNDDPRGRRRLYTRAQVEGIVRIAHEEGVLVAHQKPMRATNFTPRVIALFQRLAEK